MKKLLSLKKKNLKQYFLVFFIILFGITSFITKKFSNSNISIFFQIIIFLILIIILINLLLNYKFPKISFIKKINLNLKDFQFMLIYIFIALLSLWKLIITPGVIGLRDDWSIPQLPGQVIDWSNFYKTSWLNFGFGERSIYPSEYIFRGIILIINLLFNFNGELLSKGLLLIILTITGIGGFFLGKKIKLSKENSFLIGLFYMLTPVMFNRIIPGYLTFIFSYALLPFIIGLFIKYSNEKFNIKNLLRISLLTALGFTHLNFIIIIPLLFTILSLSKDKKIFFKGLIFGFETTIIALLFHLNWLLPLIININETSSFIASRTHTWVESFNPPLTNTMLLFGATYGFFSEIIQINIGLFILWSIAALLLLFVIFLPLIDNPKNKLLIKFGIITIFSLFFAKGRSPPLGFIFDLLYKNIKLLTIFRDVHNILVITSLSYATLIGFSLESLKRYLNKKVSFLIILIIILCYSWPFFTGNFGGRLNTYNIGDNYKELYANLANEKGDFKILLTPLIQPIAYLNNQRGGIDPMTMFSPKETIIPLISVNNGETNFALVVDNLLYNNVTDNLYAIFNLAGIKYVIQRNDVISRLPNFHFISRFPELNNKYNNEQIRKIISYQKNFIKLNNEINYLILKPEEQFNPFNIYLINNSNYNKIRAYNLNYFISGGYNSYIKLINNDLINPKSTIFFSSQVNNLNELSNYLTSIIIVNDEIEAVSSLIPYNYKINPGDFTLTNDADEGWTKFFDWWWYKWDYISQLDNGAFTRTKSKLNINININESGKHALLIKSYFNNESSIKIFMDNKLISLLNTSSKYNHFRWIYLTDLDLNKGSHLLTIESVEGENAISKIIITPRKVLNKSLIDYSNILERVSHKIVYDIKYMTNNLSIKSINNDDYIDINKGVNFNLSLLNKDNYSLTISGKGKGKIYLMINNKSYYLNYNNSLLINNVSLDSGVNQFYIKSNDKVVIKKLILNKDNNKIINNDVLISYNKTSNVNYELSLKSNNNFIISFSNTYDKEWLLIDNESNKYEPLLCNGFANCYLINKSEPFKANIKYIRQEIYIKGEQISILTLIISIILLMI